MAEVRYLIVGLAAVIGNPGGHGGAAFMARSYAGWYQDPTEAQAYRAMGVTTRNLQIIVIGLQVEYPDNVGHKALVLNALSHGIIAVGLARRFLNGSFADGTLPET